jgi:hypothetical protein
MKRWQYTYVFMILALCALLLNDSLPDKQPAKLFILIAVIVAQIIVGIGERKVKWIKGL